MKSVNVSEQLNAMHSMFLPSDLSEAMQKSTRCFWENQDTILEAMQAFATGWFERRHTGTRAALESAQRMCKAQTPVDLVREYQEWASGALQRMMTDGLDCQRQFMIVAGALVQPLAPLAGEREESSRAETRTAIRPKAA
jgi:hypothetical protein